MHLAGPWYDTALYGNMLGCVVHEPESTAIWKRVETESFRENQNDDSGKKRLHCSPSVVDDSIPSHVQRCYDRIAAVTNKLQ